MAIKWCIFCVYACDRMMINACVKMKRGYAMKTLQYETKSGIVIHYAVHVPNNIPSDKPMPTILFLHGAGERGDTDVDFSKVYVTGLPKNLIHDASFENFPFIVIIPQCPSHLYWPMLVLELNEILNILIHEYPIDTRRLYLTGLSMGGYGTWYLAYAFPHRFAAIAPICGSGIKSSANRLKHLPIWIFHGTDDPVIPYSESLFLFESIKNAHGNVKLTSYDHVGHDSWTQTYDNMELYRWFMQHSLDK